MALIFSSFLWPPEPLLQYACARAQMFLQEGLSGIVLMAVHEDYVTNMTSSNGRITEADVEEQLSVPKNCDPYVLFSPPSSCQ